MSDYRLGLVDRTVDRIGEVVEKVDAWFADRDASAEPLFWGMATAFTVGAAGAEHVSRRLAESDKIAAKAGALGMRGLGISLASSAALSLYCVYESRVADAEAAATDEAYRA